MKSQTCSGAEEERRGAGRGGGRRVVWVGSLSGVQGLQSGHNAGTRDAAINSPLKICHCVIAHHVCCKQRLRYLSGFPSLSRP